VARARITGPRGDAEALAKRALPPADHSSPTPPSRSPGSNVAAPARETASLRERPTLCTPAAASRHGRSANSRSRRSGSHYPLGRRATDAPAGSGTARAPCDTKYRADTEAGPRRRQRAGPRIRANCATARNELAILRRERDRQTHAVDLAPEPQGERAHRALNLVVALRMLARDDPERCVEKNETVCGRGPSRGLSATPRGDPDD
jgi:hypothetical protein